MNDDWSSVCAILRAEAPDQAERIEARLLHELGGLRLTVPKRVTITREEAHKAVRKNGGNVDKAAKDVGLSRSSMYRRIRPAPRQDSGRLVR